MIKTQDSKERYGMKFCDDTIKKFIGDLESDLAAPGGGSVAGLIASLSGALNSMVYSLTVGKKSYMALDENTQNMMLEATQRKPRLNGIQFELTSRCNERCIHCYIPNGKKETGNDIPIEKVVDKVIKKSLNVKATEELINKELLKIAGKQLSGKNTKNIKSVFPAKLYVNTIKQVFDKFNIPAAYKFAEKEDCIQITVNIPKNKK